MTSTPIFQVTADIVSNRRIGPALYWIDLHAPDVVRHAAPGQFVHLTVSDTSPGSHRPAWMQHTPLLRRPFSIAACDPARGVFGLIYRVVGGGTDVLAGRRSGEHLDVIGPLGRPFEPVRSGRPVVMIAGGVGVAPFFYLAQEALRTGRATSGDMLVLFGAATAGLLSGEEKFRAMDVPVLLATDDGSAGHPGFVTELLEKVLREEPDRCAFLYACGPTPMMRRSQTLAGTAGVPGQVSLEGIMPCGVGVCMACVVPCRRPGRPEEPPRYERVCDAGPVFDIHEVVFP
jgi:dihydroorotate dehydrogenase electron transfer subunit